MPIGKAGKAGPTNTKAPQEGKAPGAVNRPQFPAFKSHATATAESAKTVGKGTGANNTKAK